MYYEYCTDLVFAVQSTQQLNLPDGIQHRVITTFQTENYTKLEIKPCRLGSRIGDMEAEWRLRVIRDHPFKTSAWFRGGGVKDLPNLPTDSTKKLPTVGG